MEMLTLEKNDTSSSPAPKPDATIMLQVEELLKERLLALGVNPAEIAPHEISRDMHCSVYPDGSLCYSWKGEPLIALSPEPLANGQSERERTWSFSTWDKDTKSC